MTVLIMNKSISRSFVICLLTTLSTGPLSCHTEMHGSSDSWEWWSEKADFTLWGGSSEIISQRHCLAFLHWNCSLSYQLHKLDSERQTVTEGTSMQSVQWGVTVLQDFTILKKKRSSVFWSWNSQRRNDEPSYITKGSGNLRAEQYPQHCFENITQKHFYWRPTQFHHTATQCPWAIL